MLFSDFSSFHIHPVETKQTTEEFYFWKQTNINPFNELIFSWNGSRPKKGAYIFYIAVKSGKWSKWMKYAKWSADDQKTFKSNWDNSFARNNLDVIALRENQLADGFQIKIVATDGASCKDLDALMVSVSNLKKFKPCTLPEIKTKVQISTIFPKSQMVLATPRFRDLCSPTSTTVAINALLKKPAVNPISFANKSLDTEHNIHGNWILNTAEAYLFLKDKYFVFPKRLNSFNEVVAQLQKQVPVVVSVKGAIKGAPLEYKNGHLMTVIGYDPASKEVILVDTAHPSDESTIVRYSFEEFNNAWATRKNLCYFFMPKSAM